MLLPGEKVEYLSSTIQVIVSKEHTFGTDTILLADFSIPKKHETIVEIGTGCGAIPLYWCSVTNPKNIFAIDIQKNACFQLERSIKINKLEEKITVLNKDIKKTIPEIATHSCNLVVCNPPYKAPGCGIVNDTSYKRIARHEQECTIDDVTKAAERFLNFNGRLCLCQRMERLSDVITSMKKHGIEPKKIRFVQQRTSCAPKLFLIEGKRGAKPGMIALPTLLIEKEDNSMSDEMKRIYKYYGEQK